MSHPRRQRDVNGPRVGADRGRSIRPLAGAAAVGLLLVATPALAADPLAAARAHMQQGDLRAAQNDLRKVVRDDPSKADAHFLLAEVDLQLGDFAAAEKEAQSAKAGGYDPAEATRVLTEGYLAEGRFRDLLRDFPATDAPGALGAVVMTARGQAQASLGDLPAARASIATAERLSPTAIPPLLVGSALAMQAGDRPAALADIDKALAINPKSVPALIRKGDVLRAGGDLPGAIASYDAAVAAAPGDVRARLQRADALIAAGQDTKAKQDVDQALTALPGSVQGLFLRAALEVRAGQWADADAVLAKLGPFMGQLPNGYLLTAIVKERLGQMAAAEDAAIRYATRVPDDPRGAKLLAEIELQSGHPDRALPALDRIAAKSSDPAVFDLLGRAYEGVGNRVAAAQSFRKAADLSPKDPGLLARLGAAQLQLGDPKEAAATLGRSLALDPNQPQALQVLILARLGAGDTAGAGDALAALRKQAGDTPAVLRLSGLVKLATLDTKGARADFEASLKAAPDDIETRISLARLDLQEGRSPDAIARLQSILAKDPTNRPALALLDDAALQAGQPDVAIKATAQAHAAAPLDPGLTAALAQLYLRTNQPKQALAALAPPDASVVASAAGQGKGPQLSETERAAANANLQTLRGAALAADNQIPAAIDAYRQVLNQTPNALGTRLQLAALEVRTKDLTGARATIDDGLALSPGNPLLLHAIVDLAGQGGGPDAALKQADQLASAPGAPPASLTLAGDYLMGLKRYDDAAKAYQTQLSTHPSTPLVLDLAGAQVAGGHADAAAATLRNWLDQHNDDVAASALLASLDITAGRLPQAQDRLRQVIAARPNDVAALNNLAWVTQQLHQPGAQAIAQHAYFLSPSPQIADTLGWIMVQDGDPTRGLPLLQQAHAGTPDPTITYHLAAALDATGQRPEALKLLTPLLAGTQTFSERADAQALLTRMQASR